MPIALEAVVQCSIEDCERRLFAKSWCQRHYRAWREHGDPLYQRPTVEERFWVKVERTPGCSLWLGGCIPEGYGRFWDGERRIGAHVWAYERYVGPVPAGMVLDHLCRVRRCIEVKHLQPVTNKENVLRGVSPWAMNARKTHCPQGHLFDEQNTYHYDGERHCRACRREQQHQPATRDRRTQRQRERRQRERVTR